MHRIASFATPLLVLFASAASLLLHTPAAAIVIAGLCAIIAWAVSRQPDTPHAPLHALPDTPATDDALEALREQLRETDRRHATMEQDFAQRSSSLRHDVRGALSPALLIADRLMMADDAEKKRAGELISRAIGKVSDLLRTP